MTKTSPLFLISTLLLSSGCDLGSDGSLEEAAMFRGNPQHRAVYRTKAVHQFKEIKWSFETKGPVRSTPTVAGDHVYIGSGDHGLYSLDRGTGQQEWKYETGGAVHCAPAVAGGTVYITSRDRRLHAVDRKTGRQKWTFQTGELLPHKYGWDYYLSSPTIADGAVYFGGGDGHIYALDAKTGKQLWKFETGGRVRSTPAVWNGRVYCGSMDGYLYALNAHSGTQVWRFATEGASLDSDKFGFDRTSIVSSPSIAHDLILFGGRDGFLYAVDLTGREKWRHDHNVTWVVASPAVLDNTVFSAVSDQHYINAFDLQTGEEKWRTIVTGGVWSSGALAEGIAYFGSFDGNLYALDANTGEEMWRFQTDGKIISTPVVADTVVYFGSDDGKIYAVTGTAAPAIQSVKPRKAVFWQESPGWQYFQGDEAVRDYFKAAGYESLDAGTLTEFMQEHVSTRGASIVVFASDRIPQTLVTEAPEKGLFRQYLEAGGKVVWLGLPPNLATIDPKTGRITGVDRSVPERLLDIRLRAGDNWDEYGARITNAGKTWGLTGWSIGSHQVDTTQVTTVLAIDEYGRTSAWVKSYGGPEGTGFVQLWGGLAFRKI